MTTTTDQFKAGALVFAAMKAGKQKQAEPAVISSLTFEPAAGSNLARAMDQAQCLAAEFQGAAVVFRHGALEVTVKAGGVV